MRGTTGGLGGMGHIGFRLYTQKFLRRKLKKQENISQ